MKERLNIMAGILGLTLMLALPVNSFALSERPLASHEYQNLDESLWAQQFAESDALRFQGLFGPLYQAWGSSQGLYPGMFGYADTNHNPINARDIGFGSNEDHYIAINQRLSF